MNVSTRVREGVLIVDLNGQWPRKAEGWDTLRADITSVLTPWSAKFVLKICDEQFVGAFGLGVLMHARRAARPGEPLVLIWPSPWMRAVFNISCWPGPIELVESEEEALGLPPAPTPKTITRSRPTKAR